MSDLTTASTPPSVDPDAYAVRPVYVTLLVVFVVILVLDLPGISGFLLAPIVLVASPALLVVALVSAIRLMHRGNWRRGVSIVLAAGLPIIVWKPIIWLAKCTHLALTIGFGIGQIGPSFISEDKRFEAYDWSVGMSTGPSTFLIYDATDQIARSGKRLHGFKCTVQVQHVIAHYYLCSF